MIVEEDRREPGVADASFVEYAAAACCLFQTKGALRLGADNAYIVYRRGMEDGVNQPSPRVVRPLRRSAPLSAEKPSAN